MARFDAATGRYVYLTIDGVEYRVYFEEAGEGIPLLLQHTAGADGRQWRHLLEDAGIGRHFRMIAYDLPYHAKSVPPPTVEWWKKEYALTRDFFMKMPVALSAALELERPVFMGCSIGGHLAADLACFYPGVFRAAIGLEGALPPRPGAISRSCTIRGSATSTGRNHVRHHGAAEPRGLPARDRVGLFARRARCVQGRSALLQRRPRPHRPRREDRHDEDRALRADRRVRLVEHAGDG